MRVALSPLFPLNVRVGDPGQLVPAGLDPKVAAVYRGVGVLLSRYTTGKIPKAFKVDLSFIALGSCKQMTVC